MLYCVVRIPTAVAEIALEIRHVAVWEASLFAASVNCSVWFPLFAGIPYNTCTEGIHC